MSTGEKAHAVHWLGFLAAFLGMLAQVATLGALYVAWQAWQRDVQAEKQDRQEQAAARMREAWRLIAAPASGNSGKAEALEYLNSLKRPDGRPLRLIGVNFFFPPARTYLEGVQLSGADMPFANFRNADVQSANFAGANLIRAHFESANARNVNFRNADLHGAFFSSLPTYPKTAVWGADFTGADLRSADLSATDVAWSQVQSACMNAETKLPAAIAAKKPTRRACKLANGRVVRVGGDPVTVQEPDTSGVAEIDWWATQAIPSEPKPGVAGTPAKPAAAPASGPQVSPDAF
jgi:hypothetical protein